MTATSCKPGGCCFYQAVSFAYVGAGTGYNVADLVCNLDYFLLFRPAVNVECDRNGIVLRHFLNRLHIGAGLDEHIDVRGTESMKVQLALDGHLRHPCRLCNTLEGAGRLCWDIQQGIFRDCQLKTSPSLGIFFLQELGLARLGKEEQRFEQPWRYVLISLLTAIPTPAGNALGVASRLCATSVQYPRYQQCASGANSISVNHKHSFAPTAFGRGVLVLEEKAMQYDANEFYPTPPELIAEMLSCTDQDGINTILEPSAGKGNIIKYPRQQEGRYGRKTPDIDAIEISPEPRHILKGQEMRVVHDDFLTYEIFKRYDLVAMNPVFSEWKSIRQSNACHTAMYCMAKIPTGR